MAWLAVDEDKDEWIYMQKPERFNSCWDTVTDDCYMLPNGAIRQLLGKKITWDNEAVEI